MQRRLSSPDRPPLPRPIGDGDADAIPALGKRIAIVEDEMMVAWSLESTVEDLGYPDVRIFSNGEAMLSALSTHTADLVLMDINLGDGIDGIEAARRIRAVSDIPIIFISAYADPATRERIATTVAGAAFLRKPVQTADLKAALTGAFEISH